MAAGFAATIQNYNADGGGIRRDHNQTKPREMVKVKEQEKEQAIIRFLIKFPGYSNDRISYIFRFDPERIQGLRSEIDTEDRGSALEAIEC